jgi:CubicO group peptidase (beta-lactamase class C family)
MLYIRTSCASPLDAFVLYADDPLLFEPGTDFEYSSYGWTLVAAVVESAAGEPFLQFMQREVFDPLGLSDTVPDDPARHDPETTSFYWPFTACDPTKGIEDCNNPDNTCLLGAAALLSTPTDVVRFGAAMLDGRLIQAETLDMLRTPLELASGESTGHGLGWSVRRVPIGPTGEPATAFGHDGLSAGGTTSFVTVPEHDLVIAVTANVSLAGNLPSLSARLADLFAASSHLDLDGR